MRSEAGFRYELESYGMADGRFHISGWIFHTERQVVDVTLLVRTDGAVHPYVVKYGLPRDDIGARYPEPTARQSGFWAAGVLTYQSRAVFQLEVTTDDGVSTSVALFEVDADSELVGPEAPRMRRIGGVRVSRERWRKAFAMLKRGDIPLMLRKISTDIRERRLERSTKTVGQLIEAVDRDLTRHGRTDGEQLFFAALREAEEAPHGFMLIVDHDWGGGANRYRSRIIEQSLEGDGPVLLLTPMLAASDLSLEVITRTGRARYRAEALADVLALAERVPCRQIVLNNTVAFDDPLLLVEALTSLQAAKSAQLIVIVHDYSILCPSWALLDDTGHFCGVPDLARCDTCLPANKWEYLQLMRHTDTRSWRSIWIRCLDAASKIICFSASSVNLVRRAYPQLDYEKVQVKPHVVDYLPSRRPHIDLASDLHIGVVGFLSYHKGTQVLEELAAEIRRRGLACPITVFGSWDSPPVPRGIRVTRALQPEELAGLIERHGTNVFLFPSIVPETFSFVCEELMQLGVPLAVFDLGAPPERVATYERGLVLTSMDAPTVLDDLLSFKERLLKEVT